MAADIRIKYPSTSSTAITITLVSLATSSTLLVGRESTSVENTNDDLDHLISGRITLGTSPTVDKTVAVYVFAPVSIATGTPTWPDVMDGTDSAETITSEYVKFGFLTPLWAVSTDATTDLALYMPPTSLVSVMGYMPEFYGLFVTHDSGVNLNSTGSNQYLHYHRIQAQTV